jgi:uncharacterized repeat protein (TIGR01451 family)
MWRLGLLFAVIVAPLAVMTLANTARAAPDVTVTVTILRFEEVNCPDDDIFEPCPGDYYSKVAIHDSGLQISTRAPDDTAPHNPAGWTFTKTVDKALGTIAIAIELHDHDDEGPDEWVDIAPGDNTLNLTLDLNTGSWSGDNGVNQNWTEGTGDDAAKVLFDISIDPAPDTDGDGIPDRIERFGVRNLLTGAISADLGNPANFAGQAADPCRKTILMEIDWMQGAADGHNHRPKDGAVNELVSAFNNAPVSAVSPCPWPGFGGSGGVQLMIDRNNGVAEAPTTTLAQLDSIRNVPANFDTARRPYFHYVLFAHDQTAPNGGSSGVCCTAVKDFLVTLGAWRTLCVATGPDNVLDTPRGGDDGLDPNGNATNGPNRTCETSVPVPPPVGNDDQQLLAVGNNTDDQVGTVRDQSGTVMHELGHALGLAHRGGDDVNHTPNYLSAMNYFFQQGIPLAAGGSTLDYSSQVLPTLTESSLSEQAGIGGPPQYQTNWFDPTGQTQLGPASGPIDWNRDGTIQDPTGCIGAACVRVNVDINNDSACLGGGPDAITTVPQGDDVIAAGALRNGPDDTCQTEPGAGTNDVRITTGAGGTPLNIQCLGGGPNRTRETAPAGDDQQFTTQVQSGPDRICNTTASGDDTQVVPVGRTEPSPHPGYNDWVNLKYRAAAAPTAGGTAGDHGHPGDLTYAAVLAQELRLQALLEPDLKAIKTVDDANPAPGATLTYTVTAENISEGDATDVRITDTLPDGSIQTRLPGTVIAGKSAREQFTFAIPCGTPDGTVLVNSATMSAKNLQGGPEVDTSNNSASASATVRAPILTLAKTATASVNAGEAITYRLTYGNIGGGAAASVTITDTLPADVYYSVALDSGAGPQPSTVVLNADGSRTLTWNVGALAGNSGAQTIQFTARPTLLALGGTAFVNRARLTYSDANNCTYPPVEADNTTTTITVVAASRDPKTLGFWRNHPELWTAEIRARIQATDQRYDGVDGSARDGGLSATETAAMYAAGGNEPKVLEMQLLSVYFNLATRRINAGTAISSRTAAQLGLRTVRDAALYAIATLALPVNAANSARYSDANKVLDEINNNRSEVY